MASYSELIKNFEKIRVFARDFFIFGIRGRRDYRTISPRSYDNERRRIESYLNEHIVKNRDNKGKTISISSNTLAKTSNPLFKIWQTKSFTNRDCFLHYLILDILKSNDSLSVFQIAEIINKEYTIKLNNDETIDNMTIHNKLNEYVKLGILEVKKRGKTLYYSITKNPLDGLNPETMENLNIALSYYKNIMPAGFIGYSINNESDGFFIYRQIFFAQILDDDILLQILKAIKNKQIINLNVISNRSSRKINTFCVPIKIISNTKTGRRYVIVYNIKKKKFSSIRLDYIKDIVFGNIFSNYDDIKWKYTQLTKNSFSLMHQTSKKLHYVRMVLNIDEKTEIYVLERLKREGKHGTISKINSNTFEYTIEVPDLVEMFPWLRTFIGRIIRIEGTPSKLISQFKKDIQIMHNMYFE